MKIREIMNLLEATPDKAQQAVAALRADPLYGAAAPHLPAFAEWADIRHAKAWFSPYHFTGNDAFELPFDVRSYVYSPVVDLPLPQTSNVLGHYRRGVRKYQTMLRKGQTLPPITIVYDARANRWGRQDGNHRWEAAINEGRPTIPAIFAYPIRALKD